MTRDGGVFGAVGEAGRAIWSGGRGWILVAISAGWAISLGVRLAFPAVLPGIKAEFGLSNTAAGVVIGALWIAYATSQLPGGFLGDRVGERATLVASTLLAGGALLLTVLAPAFPLFLAGVVLFGLASGLYGTLRVTVLSAIYPSRGGTAMGLQTAAGNLGAAALPTLAGVLAGAAGWRLGLGAGLPLFLVVAVGLAVALPRRTSSGDPPGSPRDVVAGLRRALSLRPVALAAAVMVLMSVVYQAYTGFLPTYLVAAKGFSGSAAASLLGAFFGVSVVIQPLAGGVADRHGRRPTLVVLAAGTFLSLLALPFASSPLALAGLVALSSLQLAFWPVVFDYVTTALPEAVRGSGFGLLQTVSVYVSAGGPVAVGALGDAGLFDEAFLLLAGLVAATLVVCLRLPAARA